MTTREFINKYAGIADGKVRECSSVFKDADGNIYSYGYHYPLIFKVGGLFIRNTSGYSNTTARHIQWTRDIDAVDVPIRGCNQYSYNNSENAGRVPQMLYNRRYNDGASDSDLLEAITADLYAARRELNREMAKKRRKDTQVYKWLEYQMDDLNKAIKQIGA